jgi:putative ATP-dependent endonuclease of OLD family
MLGLFSAAEVAELPLTSAGLGTQQLTMFVLTTTSLEVDTPIFVVDELESGLEPFRQRELVQRIRDSIGASGQAFMTTHSPAVVGALNISELSRIERQTDGAHSVAPLPSELHALKQQDPEGLLCRLPALVEGQTELGLLDTIAASMLRDAGTTIGALGIRLIDGGGQPNVFTPLRGLKAVGLPRAAFLDTETTQTGKRQELSADPLVIYGTYTDGCGFEDALAADLSLDALDALICLPAHGGHDVSTARYQQLNHAAGSEGRRTVVELDAEPGIDVRRAFATAANGSSWFKTRANAAIVGEHLLAHHRTSRIVQDVEGFWNRVLAVLGLDVTQKSEDSDL